MVRKATVTAAPPLDGRTRLVGANLPPVYHYKLALIAAHSGEDKKFHVAEALDDLFAKYEAMGVLVPTAAEIAERTLKGDAA